MAKQNTIDGDTKRRAAIEYMTMPYGSKYKVAEELGVAVATVGLWVKAYKKYHDHAFTKMKCYPISWVEELLEQNAKYQKEIESLLGGEVDGI